MKFLTEIKILSGNFTTIVDNYLNLKKYIDIQPVVVGDREKAFNILYRNVGDVSMLHNEYDRDVEDDTIITTFKFIADFVVLPDVMRPCNFRCKNLIVLDTWNWILAEQLNVLSWCYDLMKRKSERLILLGNPALFRFFAGYEYYEYYEKLSKERLEFLRPKKDNGQWLVRGNGIPVHGIKIQQADYFKSTNKQIFECRGYQYHRFNHMWSVESTMSPPIYFENIGKLLFEFRYFDKPVKYYNINRVEDGLTHYLRLFDVDDSITQYLQFAPEDVADKLFMKEDDFLVQLLRSL